MQNCALALGVWPLPRDQGVGWGGLEAGVLHMIELWLRQLIWLQPKKPTVSKRRWWFYQGQVCTVHRETDLEQFLGVELWPGAPRLKDFDRRTSAGFPEHRKHWIYAAEVFCMSLLWYVALSVLYPEAGAVSVLSCAARMQLWIKNIPFSVSLGRSQKNNCRSGSTCFFHFAAFLLIYRLSSIYYIHNNSKAIVLSHPAHIFHPAEEGELGLQFMPAVQKICWGRTEGIIYTAFQSPWTDG